MYRLTSEAKLPAAIAYIEEIVINRGCKTLVFAHHQNVLVSPLFSFPSLDFRYSLTLVSSKSL